jgi:hypothetical protein
MDMHRSLIGLLARLNRSRRNLGHFMPQPPLDPPVADTAPNAETLTSYDEEHLVTYLRLLDAEADGADWTEATRLVLHIDASREPARARRAWESHLARAKWMTEHGYQHLLRGRAPG